MPIFVLGEAFVEPLLGPDDVLNEAEDVPELFNIDTALLEI